MSIKQRNLLLGLVVVLFLIIIFLGAALVYALFGGDDKGEGDDINNDQDITSSDTSTSSDITNFEECKDAGYPIMESYPQQCATPDGQTFTEIIDDDSVIVGVETAVKVYFPRDPDSMDDYSKVFAVNRSSDRTDIGTFVIEQLITGPTAAEKLTGLIMVVPLSGESNCSGEDFSLNINKTTKVATLKFCKTVESSGIGDDARITASIESTLDQFSSVDEVIILTKTGHCFGDESGMDLCLD